jgi:hypothetical protein
MRELNIGVASMVELHICFASPITGDLAAAEAKRADRVDGIADVHRGASIIPVIAVPADAWLGRKSSTLYSVDVEREALLSVWPARYRQHVPAIVGA